MIIYSVVPLDIIFKDFEKCRDVNYIEAYYRGERVILSPLNNNELRIERVISTSPKTYLDPGLQPGTIIKGNDFLSQVT